MDDDILELQEDGSYEITSTIQVKQAPPDLSFDYSKFPFDLEEENESILQNLTDGNFKIYKAGNAVFFIIKLLSGDIIQQIKCSMDELCLVTKCGKKYSIPLKDLGKINTGTGICSSMKEFLTIKFDLA